MKEYTIKLVGCDDETYIIKDLTNEQYEFLKIIQDESADMCHSQCMPILIIRETAEDDRKIVEDQIKERDGE